MSVSKAIKGYEELIKLKTKEMEQYYLQHKDIIKPFLLMKKEIDELQHKSLNTKINFMDDFLKGLKKRG